MILTETERRQVERATVEMLLSPLGRQWSRPFLTERGKGDEANLAQIKRELLDILSNKITDLYASPEPVSSRGTF